MQREARNSMALVACGEEHLSGVVSGSHANPCDWRFLWKKG